MHSIATWPGDPSRVALAISAVGVWLTDDGGETWRNGNKGMYPRYMPEEAREETLTLCVHNMHRAPKRPERLFMQFHGGVYRSDDAGESWASIAITSVSSAASADFSSASIVALSRRVAASASSLARQAAISRPDT